MQLNDFVTPCFLLNNGTSPLSRRTGVTAEEIPWGGKQLWASSCITKHFKDLIYIFRKQVPGDLLRHWQGFPHLTRWRSSCLPALFKQCHRVLHYWAPYLLQLGVCPWRINQAPALRCTAPSHSSSTMHADKMLSGVTCFHLHWAEFPGDALQWSSLLLLRTLSSFIPLFKSEITAPTHRKQEEGKDLTMWAKEIRQTTSLPRWTKKEEMFFGLSE